jgi:hypothetical protein
MVGRDKNAITFYFSHSVCGSEFSYFSFCPTSASRAGGGGGGGNRVLPVPIGKQ